MLEGRCWSRLIPAGVRAGRRSMRKLAEPWPADLDWIVDALEPVLLQATTRPIGRQQRSPLAWIARQHYVRRGLVFSFIARPRSAYSPPHLNRTKVVVDIH